jgi:hypothetical protein
MLARRSPVLPAALLTRMLGIDITVAVAWQRVSGGDWRLRSPASPPSRT